MIMVPANEPLTASILVIMYFGDVVFAVSGALTAARHRMDVMGFVLIGTITGTGGGTTRDLLLGRTVWWTQDPLELTLCVTATGGGLIRDVITNTQPMIMSGQVYATAALLGSLSYASLRHMGVPEIPAEIVACLAAFSLGLRLSSSIFAWDHRMNSSVLARQTTIIVNNKRKNSET